MASRNPSLSGSTRQASSNSQSCHLFSLSLSAIPSHRSSVADTAPDFFYSLRVINAPRHCFSIGNTVGKLDISRIDYDNSAGDAPNAQSNGLPAAHNSDAFDVSAVNVIIRDSHVINQGLSSPRMMCTRAARLNQQPFLAFLPPLPAP